MHTVDFEIYFSASPSQVWDAWTQPAAVIKWFGSDPLGHGVSATLDVRPGGAYSISFRDSDGTDHTCFGKYEHVAYPRELTFSWEWQSEPGHCSRVSIELLPAGAATLMKFTHSRLNPESLHGYEEGWKRTFAKLQSWLNSVQG